MGELHGAPLSSLEPASSIPQRSTEIPMSTLTIMAPVVRGPTSQVARVTNVHPNPGINSSFFQFGVTFSHGILEH